MNRFGEIEEPIYYFKQLNAKRALVFSGHSGRFGAGKLEKCRFGGIAKRPILAHRPVKFSNTFARKMPAEIFNRSIMISLGLRHDKVGIFFTVVQSCDGIGKGSAKSRGALIERLNALSLLIENEQHDRDHKSRNSGENAEYLHHVNYRPY
jgi:hypothetical protein